MKNTKTTNILLIIIIVILLAPALLLGLVYFSNMLTMQHYYDPSVAQSTPAPKRTMSVRQAADVLDDSCEREFHEFFSSTLDESSGLYKVNVWMTYLDDEAIERTKSGEDEEDLEVWNNMSSDLLNMTNNLQKFFNEHCEEDITAVLALCPPEDHNKEYLVIANGMVGYDVVNEIDLRKSS